MYDLDSVLKVPGLPTLISFIIGFGLACMFRPLCKGTECVILRGPPVADIRGSVYQFGSKCVEFVPKPIECPKSQTVPVIETITFAEMN